MSSNPFETPPPSAEGGRAFNISSKTPHSELVKCTNPGGDTGFKRTVVKDIMANAMELTPTVDWKEVFQHLKASRQGRLVTGESALINSAVTPRMAVIARELGVSMDDSRIAYLSSVHVVWSLDADVRQMNERAREIEAGERQFISAEAKQHALAKANADAGRLGAFSKRIKDDLAAYAENQFISPQQQSSYFPWNVIGLECVDDRFANIDFITSTVKGVSPEGNRFIPEAGDKDVVYSYTLPMAGEI